MKNLFTFGEHRTFKCLIYLLIIISGHWGYRKIVEKPTTEMVLDEQQVSYDMKKVEWTLQYYQDILNNTYDYLRDLTEQKEEYIKLKGSDWYQGSVAESEEKINYYQNKLQDYKKKIENYKQASVNRHAYPELFKYQNDTNQLKEVTYLVKEELNLYPQIYGETEDYNNSLKALQIVVGATEQEEKMIVEMLFRSWYKEYSVSK